jgi:hypothetical protein
MFLRSRVGSVVEADNLTNIVNRLSRTCGLLNITQPCRLQRPVTGIALLLPFLYHHVEM